MKVAIPLTGTRGDVQPLVALGRELRGRGHDVVLGTPPNLVEFATRAGLRAQPCGPDVQKLYSSAEGQKALLSGNTFRLMQLVAKQMADYAQQMNREVIEVCEGADVIVSIMETEDRAFTVSQATGVPMVTLHTVPYRFNAAYPFPGLLPVMWKPPAFVNKATWSLAENLRRLLFSRYLNDMRATLGMSKSYAGVAASLERAGVPEVQIYSPLLVPGLAGQWDDRRPFAGFLPLDREGRAAVGELGSDLDDVLAWIEAGEKPVYFSFGSMPIRDTGAILAMVTNVCRRLGLRALVNAGWSDLAGDVDEHVYVGGPFANDILFPKCAAALNHGGIGTLFETLHAGLPTVVCPVSFDQPMWGAQVVRLGVGAHVPFTKLDEDRLTEALLVVTAPDTVARTRDLADRLRADEDGRSLTADIVEQTARHIPAPPR